MGEEYFKEIRYMLESLQISQTQEVINLMKDLNIKLSKWDNPNQVDLDQLFNALKESIYLLEDYNKKWRNKTRYTSEDKEKFVYQKGIVTSRIPL